MAGPAWLLYGAYVASGATSSGNTLPAAYGLYAVAVGAALSVVGAALSIASGSRHSPKQRSISRWQSSRTWLGRSTASTRSGSYSHLRVDPAGIQPAGLWAVWQAPGAAASGVFVRSVGDDAAWRRSSIPSRCGCRDTLEIGAAFRCARQRPRCPRRWLRATHLAALHPLEFEGERLGALCGDRGGSRLEAQERDLALASALASGIVIAMANARLYQQATAQARRSPPSSPASPTSCVTRCTPACGTSTRCARSRAPRTRSSNACARTP